MADIVTRQEGATPKNAPLTNKEVDDNFINLNTELAATSASIQPTAQEEALIIAIALG